ncbi:MAG TPA: insulinase family protein [Thermoanaerobaculia bacterium]|nr:insulinase family protein [Thermoanaerobaculia bacterium]
MKTIRWIFGGLKPAATFVLLLFASSAFAQATSVAEIKAPPLRKFSMPQPKRVQLANGMVIFLQEDHELPLIRAAALIRGGERNASADRIGLLSIYAGSWRTGGTASKTGDELDQFLEARAARVETGGGVESTNVSLDVLKGDFDAVFPIWADVLRNPAFRQDKIDLAKTQANTAISRRNDEPGGILARELVKLGYGPGSPYARQAEYATINSITRDDLVAFHKRFVHPNNIIVSVIGDFDSAKVEKKLRDAFSKWPRGQQVPPPVTDVTPARPGVYFVAKEDVTQANIGFVHPGVTRDNPDYYALVVMNEVFSGGFSGRLMQRLRSERGLTYGVGGGVGANWDYPGLFRAQMSTKSSTTLESIDALRGEINKLTKDPVTAAELSLAKESILNAFVFTMDTRAKALGQQVQLEFYGFPSDYWQKYPSNLEKVTAADAERVAKKYVHPGQLALLVVGNEKDFEKPLATLGNVQSIDITIPEPGAVPGATQSAPPVGSNAEGAALAKKVAAFVGNVAQLTSLKRTASMSMVTPQGPMEMEIIALMQYPQSQRVEMKMPTMQVTRVTTPEAGFMITPMGTQDIPSSQRAATMAELKTDLLVVLKNIDNPKYTFAAAGTEKIGEVSAAVIEIGADGPAVKWFVDPATGRLLRTSQSSPQGEMVTEYTEWKNFGGLNLPATAVVLRNGEKAAEMAVSAVEVNPGVPEDAFVKPAGK